MGVLDDAIRAHLELKRKHGASEQEVDQQAQEALGPPRGRPVREGEAVVEEPTPEPVAEAAEEPVPEQETVPEPEPVSEQEPLVEPPPPADEGDVEPQEEPGEEDVLEETPDFLQETPEHDRLWFEQKPPRDFDFDE